MSRKRQISIQLDEEDAKKMEKIRDKTSMPVSRQIELELKGFKIVEDKKTVIQLRKVTVECLKKLGKKGETYDDIIKRLIHEVYPDLKSEIEVYEVLDVSDNEARKIIIKHIKNKISISGIAEETHLNLKQISDIISDMFGSE